MPTSGFVKHYGDGSIVLKDGTSVTPIDVTVPFDMGDLSVSDLSAYQKEVVAYEARGERTALRYAGKIYPTFSFTAQQSSLLSATDNNPADAVCKTGAFASAVSTLGANQEVYTLDLVFTEEGTDFGDGTDGTITLEDCACTISFAEGQPNLWTISGTCYGTITRV